MDFVLESSKQVVIDADAGTVSEQTFVAPEMQKIREEMESYGVDVDDLRSTESRIEAIPDAVVAKWYQKVGSYAADVAKKAYVKSSEIVKEYGPGALESVHVALDTGGLFPAVGAIPDLVNAAIYTLEGDYDYATLSLAAAVPIAGQAATAAKYASKGAKMAEKAGKLSPKAARKQAMREAGIPVSQQPVAQKSYKHNHHTPVGRQYSYEVPVTGRYSSPIPKSPSQLKSVQHSLTDRVPGHGPHWEAGTVKSAGQKDNMGRPRLDNKKTKIEY